MYLLQVVIKMWLFFLLFLPELWLKNITLFRNGLDPCWSYSVEDRYFIYLFRPWWKDCWFRQADYGRGFRLENQDSSKQRAEFVWITGSRMGCRSQCIDKPVCFSVLFTTLKLGRNLKMFQVQERRAVIDCWVQLMSKVQNRSKTNEE